MANLAFAWNNLADAGTWTASDALASAPVSRLQNRHVMRKWRVNASTAYVVCDLLSQQSIDTFALIGMVGTDPALRVSVSTADPTGAAMDAYDSGSLSSAWDSDYLPFVHLLSSPVTGRYVRFDIAEGGAPYIEAGRGLVALRTQFAINFAPGWQLPYFTDPSLRTVGRSGQTFVELRDKFRTCSLTLPWVSETQINNFVRDVNIALGQTGDLLFITDPDSDNLSRDCIWGYFESDDPPTEPQIVSGEPVLSKTYKIRERL